MYAQRYDGGGKGKSVGLGAAVAVNAGLLALLMTTGVVPTTIQPDKPLVTEHIPLDLTPPPEPVAQPRPERAEPSPAPLPFTPQPIIDLPAPALNLTATTILPLTPPPSLPLTGTGSGSGIGSGSLPAEPAPPALIGAEIDSRFARAFQPDYPAAERRAEREGRVVVRVLIGIDGRVRAVELVSAASPGLFEATQRHALARWRFKPATRGGVPVESWKTMTLRFELSGG